MAKPDRVHGHKWISLRCVFPGELLNAWESAKSRAEREGLSFRPDVAEAVHNGQLLEILLAEYLAGPEYPPDVRA